MEEGGGGGGGCYPFSIHGALKVNGGPWGECGEVCAIGTNDLFSVGKDEGTYLQL